MDHSGWKTDSVRRGNFLKRQKNKGGNLFSQRRSIGKTVRVGGFRMFYTTERGRKDNGIFRPVENRENGKRIPLSGLRVLRFRIFCMVPHLYKVSHSDRYSETMLLDGSETGLIPPPPVRALLSNNNLPNSLKAPLSS